MTVHSFHIFDRKGKTLFTKRYMRSGEDADEDDEEQLSEQRKLVFGMLYSLRELAGSLSPRRDNDDDDDGSSKADLQRVQTGAATWYHYETVSGLRFCLYTTPEPTLRDGSTNPNATTLAGSGLSSSAHNTSNTNNVINSGLAVATPPASGLAAAMSPTAIPSSSSSSAVTRTTQMRAALQHIYEHLWVLFVIRSPMYQPFHPNVEDTNFEASLDQYLRSKSWFR